MSDLPLETDPRFRVLGEALAANTADGPGAAAEAHSLPDDRSVLQAAVSLVLRAGEDLEILLIKRARSERDPWSGHMALPGGRRDTGDGTLHDTAVRETREETGLDLSADGVGLGRLDQVIPSSVRLPRLSIAPFVFGVPAAAAAWVASPEVDAVHWIALDTLRSPGVQAEVDIALPGGARTFPCYQVVGEIVWGLTYRILQQFLAVYPDAAVG